MQVFLFSIDFTFKTSIDYWDRFHEKDIPLDVLLNVNNDWMLRNMEKVTIMPDAIPENIPHTTKIILQGLFDNTNCIFRMQSFENVTKLFGRKGHIKMSFKKGMSLSLVKYAISSERSKERIKIKAETICNQVTKWQIEKGDEISSIDTIDFFSNVTELELCYNELFTFSIAAHLQPLQPKFTLSKFPKLKDLSLLFKYGPTSDNIKVPAIHIPKQIQTLKIDKIYSKTNDESPMPIAITNNSELRTLEINCSVSRNSAYTGKEINNFIEIVNLCNTLNHFKCLKINMDLYSDNFYNALLNPTNHNRINPWQHAEQRTIIVTFSFEVDDDHCLSNAQNMQILFKDLFEFDVKLIFCTRRYETYDEESDEWVPDS